LRDGLAVVADAAETSQLAYSVADNGGVWAVPAFQGLGTPFGESRARAVVGGLSRGSRRAHVVRAVLEGIAERVVDVADEVWQETPDRPVALRVDGGASRNDFLMQRQADFLGVPVERSPISDGSALGVARMAAVAVGTSDGVMADNWQPDRIFEPSMGVDERAARRARWKRRLTLVSSDLAE
jgi:glycerol kinase